jgi:outer membrane receptor protein involved in Fe transport
VTGTYTFENRFQSNPLSIDRECIGQYSVNCDPPQPEWQFSQRATWSWNQFDVSVLHRYIGSTAYETALLTPASTIVNAYRQIDAANYLDLTGRWRINDMIEATVTVNNLLDKDPPLVGNNIGTTGFNTGNTYPTVYDALGRTYNFGIRVRL